MAGAGQWDGSGPSCVRNLSLFSSMALWKSSLTLDPKTAAVKRLLSVAGCKRGDSRSEAHLFSGPSLPLFPHYVLHQLKSFSARPWTRQFCTLAHCIFPAPSGYYFPPFNDTRPEALRGSVTCLKSHSLLVAKLGFGTSAVCLSQDTEP